VCNPLDGLCQAQPANEGGICDDGLMCTNGDTCTGGSCIGTAVPGCQKCAVATDCDDGDPCTDDSCHASGFCLHTNNVAPCDDADPCTQADTCSLGVCAGTPIDCSPLDDACHVGTCNALTGLCEAGPANDTGPCDDGDPCTLSGTCLGGTCTLGPPIDCSGVSDPCNVGVCNPGTGVCEPVPANEGAICDDMNPCTDTDICVLGTCAGSPVAGCTTCTTAGDCDDADPCTDDACHAAGFCTHNNNTALCDDGNSCTVNDTCSLGLCAGSPVDCTALDDQCNVGVCNSLTGVCEAQPSNEGLACSDGDLCTVGDLCTAGVCGGTAVDCTALDNACNVGVCNAGTGLCESAFINEAGPCDDADPCTGNDTCTLGVCLGSAVDCTPLNDFCNIGVCNALTGVCEAQPTNEGGSCEDGLFCNGAETCTAGVCTPGTDPCAGPNPNLVCDDILDTCVNTCIHDCNFTAAVDVADYSFFLGCFGLVINPGDSCACADYNGNGVGDVGDYSGLLGCFGQFCPCPAGVPLALEPRGVQMRLVVSGAPDGLDYARALPASSVGVSAGDTFYVQVWASLQSEPVDGLACAAADLFFSPRTLRAEDVTNAEGYSWLQARNEFVDRGLVRNIGGCIGLDQLNQPTGMAWARVATVEMTARKPGVAWLQLSRVTNPTMGFARVGDDFSISPSEVKFGDIELRVRRPASVLEGRR
ncbi:MAG: hypothetical protein ACE5EX_00015, partial [Phycisphaerae bacterium]